MPPPSDDDAGPRARVLAFDVGQKNMGVCLLAPGDAPDGSRDAVEHWEVLRVDAESARSVAAGLEGVVALARRAAPDVVAVVERQPPRNQKMTRLQHYVEAVLAVAGVEVFVQDAAHKLNFAATTPWWPREDAGGSWTYAARKKLAVRTAAGFVAGREPWASRFGAEAKKDDMADALLHAMAHAHHLAPQRRARASAVASARLAARRPSDGALASGRLSKGAIKWMLLHATPDALQAPAFARAVERQFGGEAACREACGLAPASSAST